MSPAFHDMLPAVSHDEAARQQFVGALRAYLSGRVMPGNYELYGREIEPRFIREHGRAPVDRNEIRPLMTAHPYYQFWSALQRRSQEMLWQSCIEPTERQLPELIERYRRYRDSAERRGSLRLDPSLPMPRYLTQHDIHSQPGAYHTEQAEDDVAAGAIYEAGLQMYIAGGWGAFVEAQGQASLECFRRHWPEHRPARMLDMGCTVGNGTRPWALAFPAAEVHAIDVAAPILRYAHARAEALGVAIHFSQQNAEATDFPDGSFDLVTSHIMLHETSRKALPRILAESLRLLRPGGIMWHIDIPRGQTTIQKFMHDWESYNNNESFARFMTDLDLAALAEQAGWPAGSVRMEKLVAPLGLAQKNYTTGEYAFRIVTGKKP
jgi:2-polyprenyl-3-methyl-5-hydroxy-6-metoxy-1,4-benzoquinol methylase